MTPDELDNLFFDRAIVRGLIDASAVASVRSDLAARRGGSPSLTAAEVAIEKGLMGAEAAIALMNADPNESVAELMGRTESDDGLEHLPIDSGGFNDIESTSMYKPLPEDEEPFLEVPQMVEPLAPSYAISDSNDSQELQMELDPPDEQSGDSLFEDNYAPLISLETDRNSPKVVFEEQDGDTIMEITIGEPTDTLQDQFTHPESDLIPVTDTALDPMDTVDESEDSTDTARYPKPEEMGKTPPVFENVGSKGASQDFGAFEDENYDDYTDEDSDDITDSLVDSAVGEVMEQADEGYFGAPADMTVTPPELIESSIPSPVSIVEETLFDSESDEKGGFVATAPHETIADASRPSDEITNNSDFDVSVTLPGEMQTDASTIYDNSDVSLEEITDESSLSGSGTHFATGEQVRPGLADRDSQLGVESDITGDQIEGHEMTLADIRAEMGIGNGVKVGDGAVDRLKKGGGAKRRYSVVREIARGGMGKVMEVEDNDLRRPVALKVLRKEMLDRKDLVERFLEEAQITGQLEHPNIVPVHEIGVDGRGNLYFTMKLVEGEELASIIKRLCKKGAGAADAWPISRLIDTFIKICEGIAFAHSRGVIHRDLKPANIMVGRFGEVQIMDWGVAKIIGRKEETADRVIATDRQDDDAMKTMVGSILGTPSYMSPEQARGEVDSMGGESDVFALGVILYELLALCTPWTAQTSAQVIDQVKHFHPELPSARTPDRKISAELERLAMKCLEKEPHKRIRDVQDLVDNLKSWQQGRTLAAVEYSLTQLMFKWVARHKAILLVLVLLISGASAAGVIAYKQAKQSSIDKANDNIAVAKSKVGDARKALTSSQFEKAIKLSNEAVPLFFAAENTLDEETDEIKQGKEGAIEISTSATIRKAELEDAARKKLEDAAREQEISDQLVTANLLKEKADNLEKSAAEPERVRAAYVEAESAFRIVLSIDENNKEADDAVDAIKDWIGAFESRQQLLKDMNRLKTSLKDAKNKLAAAKKIEGYEDAVDPFTSAINAAREALSVNVPGSDDDQMRKEAQEVEAEGAFELAKRALADKNTGVAAFMLKTAENAGMNPEAVAGVRNELNTLIAGQSRYKKLSEAVIEALKSEQWVLAQANIKAALAESEKSKFASENDVRTLERNLEFAKVEEIHERDSKAKASEELQNALKQYDALIDTLKSIDHKNKAVDYRNTLRLRLGQVLVEEAEQAEDPTAKGELLSRSLVYLEDKAIRTEIANKLTDIKVKLAVHNVDEGQVLLPRGNFIIGSNREEDSNPKRTFKQGNFVFIDKYLVTNEQFKVFVDIGAYDKPELWPEEVRPYLLQFVDTTGAPGPATWAEGGFDDSLAKYPVTGISWFEASAYAKWAGQRLPTPEEWEIAAGAPDATDSENNGDYSFGARASAPPDGVVKSREVGTSDWDASPRGARDMGSNVAEWTALLKGKRAIVKGAEPGLGIELFLRYARRAKDSVARCADRSIGRGFRCVRDFDLAEIGEGEKDGE